MIERSSVVVLEQLKAYITEWRELENQYYQTPSWRWIKLHRNISKRMQLTRVFTARMKHWGVIE
jgi:hypothetical protein